MRRGVIGLAIAFAVIAHGSSSLARAEESPDSAAEARQQYQDGMKAFSGKRYSEAALHFEAAAALKANAVALYTAGLAWDLASKPERAADAYARALEVPGLDNKQSTVAKDRVATLERTLGTLVVAAPEGWRVQLDTLTEVTTPARLHAAPGVHVLNVRAPGKAVDRRDVTLEAGKATPLELKEEPKAVPRTVEPEPAVEKPPPPPPREDPLPARLRESFWTTPKAIGVGVVGVGVAALGACVILGTSAEGAKDAYNAAPSRPGYDHASSLETWTNVALIGGAAIVAGGVALIVLPLGEGRSERRMRATLTPRGAAIGGTF